MSHFNNLADNVTNKDLKATVTFLTNPEVISAFIGFYTGTVKPVFFRNAIEMKVSAAHMSHYDFIVNTLRYQAPDNVTPPDHYLLHFFYDIRHNDAFLADPIYSDVAKAISIIWESITNIITAINGI